MAFIGKKYKLESQEKFDEFMNVLPVPEEFKKTVLEFKPTTALEKDALEKDGDTYTLTTTKLDGTESVSKFKSGEEFEEKIMEHNIKTTITVDGNTVTQVQKFDDGVVFTFVREFTETDLTLTAKVSLWDGEAKRYYKAI